MLHLSSQKYLNKIASDWFFIFFKLKKDFFKGLLTNSFRPISCNPNNILNRNQKKVNDYGFGWVTILDGIV